MGGSRYGSTQRKSSVKYGWEVDKDNNEQWTACTLHTGAGQGIEGSLGSFRRRRSSYAVILAGAPS
jgi:hypothetical protein